MITARSERLAEILRDEHFQSVVAEREARLTRIVMAPATPDGDRALALAEYHALHRLLGALRATQEGVND